MNRNEMIKNLQLLDDFWDVTIIGGGATGLGTAIESASRGYKTLLLEQSDFSKGTSSRSTKLIHGGVRYLKQGNVSLVLEALHERGLLYQNAPHLVRNQSFIIPNYDWWSGPFYGVGLKVYDMLSGKLGLGPSKILSKEETLKRIPTLKSEGLKGGVIYYDGQFDDSRLAINLAQTAVDYGATVINYFKVNNLLKTNDLINGVLAVDLETGKEFQINSRVVINATGVFADDILKMDNPNNKNIIVQSQGVHLTLDKEFLPGNTAIMVPQTEDGRVLFAVPWSYKVIVGTTDTLVEKPSLEPVALEEEIEFILKHAAIYMSKKPTRKDVLSVFAGLRPLVKPAEEKNTSMISRDHYLVISSSGLITITGGKWTTYRKMAEDTIDKAALVAGLEDKKSITKNLRIHGWLKHIDENDHLHVYGSEIVAINKLVNENPELSEKLHDKLPYIKAEVVWAVRKEMARTVEDVLSRRTRALLLNAKASIEMSSVVAGIMAKELNQDDKWIENQIKDYKNIAQNYVLS